MKTAEEKLVNLAKFVKERDGLVSKESLQESVKKEFSLSQDRRVFYCNEFAVRFSQAKGKSFSNTVLSLSAAQKYDNRPLIICIVRKEATELLIANTTFLKKISPLRTNFIDNIKNLTDLIYAGIQRNINNSLNLWNLYLIHESIG